MIDILIPYSSRELYLRRLLDSIERNWGTAGDLKEINLRVVYNESQIIKHPLFNLVGAYTPHFFESRVSIGRIMQFYRASIEDESRLCMKLDEDCLLVSENFGRHLFAIHELRMDAIFSGYPVGLISNAGGPKGHRHEVTYSKELDTYYGMRHVSHVGGFARVMPSEYVKHINFHEGHQEDSEVSQWALANGKPMFYLENSLIVEHQESSIGQGYRYPDYFKNREAVYQGRSK